MISYSKDSKRLHRRHISHWILFILVITMATAIFGLPVHADTNQDLIDSLVGYYTFDSQDLTDTSTYQLSGTLTSDSNITYSSDCKYGSYCTSNLTSSNEAYSAVLSGTWNTYTICVWLRYAGIPPNTVYYSLSSDGTHYFMQFDDDEDQPAIDVHNGGVVTTFNPNKNRITNDWALSCIASDYINSFARMYHSDIAGKYYNSSASMPSYSSMRLVLNGIYGFDDGFGGQYDEFMFFNKSLTGDEFYYLENNQITFPPSAVVDVTLLNPANDTTISTYDVPYLANFTFNTSLASSCYLYIDSILNQSDNFTSEPVSSFGAYVPIGNDTNSIDWAVNCTDGISSDGEARRLNIVHLSLTHKAVEFGFCPDNMTDMFFFIALFFVCIILFLIGMATGANAISIISALMLLIWSLTLAFCTTIIGVLMICISILMMFMGTYYMIKR